MSAPPVAVKENPAGGERPDLLNGPNVFDFVQLVRRAGFVFGVQVVGAGLAYAAQVLLARFLGASHYGVYAYAIVWVGFAALIAGFGLPAASIRFLPVYAGDQARIRGFVRTATRATIGMAVVMSALVVGAAWLLRATGHLSNAVTVVISALLVPAFAASLLYTEIARAQHRVSDAFVPPLIVRPAIIILGATALYLGRGTLSTDAVLVVTLGGGCAAAAAQYVRTRRALGSAESGSDLRARPERREWLRVGIGLLAAGAFTIILLQVDIVIVGLMLGSRDAGVYAAASKTAALVTFVITAVNAVATPHYAALWAAGKRREMQELVSKLAWVIFLPSLAISVGIGALSVPLLALFGSGFQAARASLLVLLVGQVINAGAGSVGYLLTLTGHHREAITALGLSALACTMLAVAGVWAFGLIGAAIGSTIGCLLWNGSLYWLVLRKLGVHASFLTRLGRAEAD